MSKGTITLIFIILIIMAAGAVLIINGSGTVVIAPQVTDQSSSTDLIASSTDSSTATTTIDITSPVAGNQWLGGGTYTVTWNGGLDNTVSLMLVDKSLESSGGSVSKVWSTDGIPNTGTYSFSIPLNLNGTYRFYINDSRSYGWSDYFSITSTTTTTSTPASSSTRH